MFHFRAAENFRQTLLSTKSLEKTRKKWFRNPDLGVESLSEIVMQKIVKQAEWDLEKLLNSHSLRTTSITALYDEDFSNSVGQKIRSARMSVIRKTGKGVLCFLAQPKNWVRKWT